MSTGGPSVRDSPRPRRRNRLVPQEVNVAPISGRGTCISSRAASASSPAHMPRRGGASGFALAIDPRTPIRADLATQQLASSPAPSKKKRLLILTADGALTDPRPSAVRPMRSCGPARRLLFVSHRLARSSVSRPHVVMRDGRMSAIYRTDAVSRDTVVARWWVAGRRECRQRRARPAGSPHPHRDRSSTPPAGRLAVARRRDPGLFGLLGPAAARRRSRSRPSARWPARSCRRRAWQRPGRSARLGLVAQDRRDTFCSIIRRQHCGPPRQAEPFGFLDSPAGRPADMRAVASRRPHRCRRPPAATGEAAGGTVAPAGILLLVVHPRRRCRRTGRIALWRVGGGRSRDRPGFVRDEGAGGGVRPVLAAAPAVWRISSRRAWRRRRRLAMALHWRWRRDAAAARPPPLFVGSLRGPR